MGDTGLSYPVSALAGAHAAVSAVQYSSALDAAVHGRIELAGIDRYYGIELIHPRREGCSAQQIGKKGLSNKRWIVGGKLCFVLNHIGLIVDWDVDTANVYDGSAFQDIVERNVENMALFADEGFVKRDWHPDNLKICKRGEWNNRMIVDTVLSMLTSINHFKKVMHRKWDYFKSRLAYTMAMFNVLVQWGDLEIDEDRSVLFIWLPSLSKTSTKSYYA